MLKISDYDFDLPKELIAQLPVPQRGESRLLVIDRNTGKFFHKKFHEITHYISKSDCLVINSSKVIPARVFARRKTGGKVEVLFTKITSPFLAHALLKPSLKEGEKIFFADDKSAEIGKKIPGGEREIIFSEPDTHQKLIQEYGVMPLPPYIKRKSPDKEIETIDKSRYQTVYAKTPGSIAAPTAGLHFTTEILNEIKQKGARIAEITLHVGPGTFMKVKTEDISEHQMLPEKFFIPQSEAEKINETIKNGGKIFATGTTTTRVLETIATEDDKLLCGKTKRKFLVKSAEGETSLYIYPGYNFQIVDCLITNFHLPRSTPLFLAAAFCGRELLLDAYREAIKEGYKFFSYGDATLII